MFNSIHEDIISNHIFTFLDFKNRYYLSIISKFFSQSGNSYKKKFKKKNNEIYLFIASKLRENIKRGLPALRNIFFCPLQLTDRIYVYNKYLENGIYFYAKNIYFENSHDGFFYFENILSHKLYIVVYVKDKNHKAKIFYKYYEPHLEESETTDFCLKFDEKIIKIA